MPPLYLAANISLSLYSNRATCCFLLSPRTAVATAVQVAVIGFPLWQLDFEVMLAVGVLHTPKLLRFSGGWRHTTTQCLQEPDDCEEP